MKRKTVKIFPCSNIQINKCIEMFTYKQKQIYIAIKLKIYAFFYIQHSEHLFLFNYS